MVKFLTGFVVLTLVVSFVSYIQPRQTLDDYTLTGVKSIEGLRNASGLTVQGDSGSLWMVINSPAQLLELQNNDVVRTIDLYGFDDTEGICWLRDDLFVVAEERKITLNVISITANTKKITKEDIIHSFQVGLEIPKNKGIEALCFDRERSELLFMTEKRPIRMFRVKVEGEKLFDCRQVSPHGHFEWTMRDASGVSIIDDRIAVLSDESRSINFYNFEGSFEDQVLLKNGYNNMDHNAPQAEGICTDTAGNLYICSEPNILYTFSKK